MTLATIVDKNLQYTYDNGWKYQFWLKSKDRIVYAMYVPLKHGGPMNGRINYQHCYVQEVRADEIFQISWVEETDTVVSLIVDLPRKHITTFMAFSNGHWNNAEKAHGNKRDTSDFKRWRNLATERAGYPSERHVLPEQASIDLIFEGRGDLEDIELDAPTL